MKFEYRAPNFSCQAWCPRCSGSLLPHLAHLTCLPSARLARMGGDHCPRCDLYLQVMKDDAGFIRHNQLVGDFQADSMPPAPADPPLLQPSVPWKRKHVALRTLSQPEGFDLSDVGACMTADATMMNACSMTNSWIRTWLHMMREPDCIEQTHRAWDDYCDRHGQPPK